MKYIKTFKLNEYLNAEQLYALPKTKEIINNEIGDMFYTNSWAEKYLAKTSNYKPNTYYRVEGTEINYTGVGQGMYLGRDKNAIKNFYDIEEQGLKIREFVGKPKWLDLTDYYTFKKFEKQAEKEFGKDDPNISNHLKKLTLKKGCDGIRYYDPLATGEEFVLFNTDKLKEIFTL